MTPPPTNIDGTDITGVTIDGEEVQEITVDGQSVFTAGPVIPDGLVDSFQDGDIAEYQGDVNGFEVQQNTVLFGDFSLEPNGTTKTIGSTSGLNSYPSQGDTFLYYVRFTNNNDDSQARMFYGVQSASNARDSYWIMLLPSLSDFRSRVDGITKTSSSPSIPYNTWLEVEVVWGTDNSHQITLSNHETSTQIDQLTFNDSTYTSGGIGFEAANSPNIVFD